MFQQLDKVSDEEVRKTRDAAQSRADELLSKQLTSLSAGAGAGLVAALAYLATKAELSPLATLLGVAALLLFFAALWFNALATMHIFNIANFTVARCENEMHRRTSLAFMKGAVSPEDYEFFAENFRKGYEHGERSIDHFTELLNRRTLGTLVCLVAGSFVFFLMVVMSSNAGALFIDAFNWYVGRLTRC